MNTNKLSTEIDRDFYATDEESGMYALKCVPAGGFAPKRTHFVARVSASGNVKMIDLKFEEALRNWLQIEEICNATAKAAEEGRFCFTNGNTCVYIEGDELVTAFIQPVEITRRPLDSEDAQKYLRSTYPHKDDSTAESLRAHAASKMVVTL
ncbi:MAG: hypothetical protein ACKOW9_06445 [Candidatus Paceibacterota bacterium]